MTQRTCNIIRACKGSLFPSIEGRIERVKTYLDIEYACKHELFDAEKIGKNFSKSNV